MIENNNCVYKSEIECFDILLQRKFENPIFVVVGKNSSNVLLDLIKSLNNKNFFDYFNIYVVNLDNLNDVKKSIEKQNINGDIIFEEKNSALIAEEFDDSVIDLLIIDETSKYKVLYNFYAFFLKIKSNGLIVIRNYYDFNRETLTEIAEAIKTLLLFYEKSIVVKCFAGSSIIIEKL